MLELLKVNIIDCKVILEEDKLSGFDKICLQKGSTGQYEGFN